MIINMKNCLPRIDMHAHYIPAAYRKMLDVRGMDKPDGFPLPKWDVSIQLERMDKLNISYAVLTTSSPHPHFGDRNECIKSVRASNEEGFGLAREYPDKICLFATLPLPEIDATVDEIEFCVKNGAQGFAMPTHAQGVYLGDERLDPVLELLNRHKSIVCIHPTTPSAIPPNVTTILPSPMMEFFFDTSRAVVNMILKGTVKKYPDIRYIVPHAGAVLPVLSDRIDMFSGVFSPVQKPDVFGDLKSFYYDISGVVVPKQLELLLSLADKGRLLYGSDGPYTPLDAGYMLAQALDETDKLTAPERDAIYIENAKKLLCI
jgi:predicted TIM-barrel fold metal-dependent hydrolase